MDRRGTSRAAHRQDAASPNTRTLRTRGRRRSTPKLRAAIEALEDRCLLTAGPVGPAFNVNAVHSTMQYGADVASDQAGRFVIVWNSSDQDSSYDGVYMRLFAADGTPLNDEAQVNQYTRDSQTGAAVAMDAAGDFVVSWYSGAQGGIMARRFAPDATARGDEFLATGGITGDVRTVRVEIGRAHV